jgi:hypothetical protein
MGNSHLSVLITRIKKQKNRLVYINELKEQFEKTLGDVYTEKKWYKLIYHLKNKWYLISLKKDIFCFTSPDFTPTESELLLNRYWLVLEHHLEHYWKKYYIGWIKALELHYWNNDIPDQLLVITDTKQWVETIMSGKDMHIKVYSQQKKSLFSSFVPFTQKVKIGKIPFTIANKELAILESLFSYDELTDRYSREYIKKILKKYELDIDTLESILKIWKHHTSINRLLDIVTISRPQQADQIKALIKKYSFRIKN